jgi:hypothetical protein
MRSSAFVIGFSPQRRFLRDLLDMPEYRGCVEGIPPSTLTYAASGAIYRQFTSAPFGCHMRGLCFAA